MVKISGDAARDLAWTVAGASAGSLARYWFDPVGPGTVRTLANTFVLASLSAVLIGIVLVASSRVPMKAALLGGGGAAASISATATHSALATPLQSVVGLAVFFAGAVAGLTLGLSVTSFAANHQREEQC